jgi:tRNA(Ile)-lysidine synthetase-like protein
MLFSAMNYLPYTFRFVKHIDSFMEQAKLYPESGKAYVAISGGADSKALAMVLMELFHNNEKFKELVLLHVNHGIREESEAEEAELKAWAREMQFELKVTHLNPPESKSNLENWARKERYKFFNEFLGKGDVVYTAHNLDDSFEWSLMKRWRSSEMISSLGIPVLRDSVRRPFLCVSRTQIENYLDYEGVEFFTDHTNDDTRFERNYIRKEVIPSIKKKYPQYLKHYVYLQNRLAKKLGVSVFANAKTVNTRLSSKKFHNAHFYWRNDFKSDFSPFENDLLPSIKTLSKAERGKWAKELGKFFAGDKVWMGPHRLAGDLFLYKWDGLLVACNSRGVFELSKGWESLVKGRSNSSPKWMGLDHLRSKVHKQLLGQKNVEQFIKIFFLRAPRSVRKKWGNGLKKSPKISLKRDSHPLPYNLWIRPVFWVLRSGASKGQKGLHCIPHSQQK